ncbi:MAG: glycosyltransferase [Acidimicrobiaceae bacterium]|nr:glycosyltransferase [Acidimicrobiaceae bacterium]
MMSSAQRHVYRGLTLLWLIAALVFWGWWLRPSHVTWVPTFVVTTLVVGYTLGLPGYFLFFVGRMRRPNPALVPPPGLRVAFATTFVPGAESLGVLERTVRAMRAQEGYPCDVWVLDEGDRPEVGALCRRVGVNHFSRKLRERYQQPVWPFKARTKAGNYNAWLDWVRSQRPDYDVLIQMDTDHAPQPGYLVEMLRPFADPAVGYVAAPSISSANRGDSWVASARTATDGPHHGAVQMGYNGGFAPMIFGSHAAFRVCALREIGGFQHTLAEDQHNTVRLAAAGWHGVFNPDAIAIGNGPESFADAMVQEYQWARAVTQLLLEFFLADQRTLPVRLKVAFLFRQTWYPLFAGSQLLSWLVPIVALLTGQPLVSVGYLPWFALHALSTLSVLLAAIWVRREGWLRPTDVQVVTWRSALLILARWPFWLVAVLEAVAGRAMGRDFAFRVTPKGGGDRKPLPMRIIGPYAVLVLGPLAAIVWYLGHGQTTANSYLYLATASAAMYLLLMSSVAVLNHRENLRSWRVSHWAALRMHAHVHGAAVILIGLLVAIGTEALPRSVEAVVGEPPAHLLSGSPAAPPSRTATTATAREIALDPKLPRKLAPHRTVVTLPDDRPFLGVYDENGALTQPLDAEEVFIPLNSSSPELVKTQVHRMLRLGRVPIVTLEPWPWEIDGMTAQTLLTDLTVGRYDSAIQSIARTMDSLAPQVIYLRFAHEMDLSDGRWPWGQGNPTAFIAAWRHVVQKFRAADKHHNVRMVWSPTGHGPSYEYYPGSDFVDVIGCTVLAAEEWISLVGPLNSQSFADVVQDPYKFASHVGKPLIVAEAGISAKDPAVRTQWIQQMRAAMTRLPLLLGVVYFNAPNPPQNTPPGTPVSDWTLSSASEQAAFLAPQVKG